MQPKFIIHSSTLHSNQDFVSRHYCFILAFSCFPDMRGYMTQHGRPDLPRSARYILKDYVNVGFDLPCDFGRSTETTLPLIMWASFQSVYSRVAELYSRYTERLSLSPRVLTVPLSVANSYECDSERMRSVWMLQCQVWSVRLSALWFWTLKEYLCNHDRTSWATFFINLRASFSTATLLLVWMKINSTMEMVTDWLQLIWSKRLELNRDYNFIRLWFSLFSWSDERFSW